MLLVVVSLRWKGHSPEMPLAVIDLVKSVWRLAIETRRTGLMVAKGQTTTAVPQWRHLLPRALMHQRLAGLSLVLLGKTSL